MFTATWTASASTPAPTPTPVANPAAAGAAVLPPSPQLPPLVRVPLPRRIWDVVVYGGTPGGVMAAVTAARAGAEVVLLEPSGHIGGMMANGLTYTDVGDHTTVGGYTADFFRRMGFVGGTAASYYHFEGKIAERELNKLLRDAGVTVHLDQALREGVGVTMAGTRIASVTMESGLLFEGRVFVDAGYEGDLLAAAGVSYRVGRESSAEYLESLAGVGPSVPIMTVPEGMALGFPTEQPGALGTADGGIQNSNYRLCFSSSPANQVPFPRPAGYDAANFEIVLSFMEQEEAAGRGPAKLTWFLYLGKLTNQKFDVNEYGNLSLGLPGANWAYPEATVAEREAIADLHRVYDQGFIWFLAHDPRVPAAIRAELATYGLCADEFTDNANWPRRIYLREARRMVGDYVLTQADIDTNPTKPDIIGIASYPLDSHFVSRWLGADRVLRMDGGFWSSGTRSWAIPYRSLIPRSEEVVNLLVPVAPSASHVAFASLRMEPQYMLMGEAAGQAAALLLVPGFEAVDVHAIDIAALQASLRAHGSNLNNPTSSMPTTVKVMRNQTTAGE
jgi:FAD-dependent oxidoreductase family protein